MNSPTQAIGSDTEAHARRHLEDQGLELVEQNFSCKLGEIDLIMRDKKEDCIAFIEVRARHATNFGEGFDTVAYQKQKKIIRTAKLYMQKNNYWDNVRFDVVSIEILPDGSYELDHIPDAFDLG